MPDSLKKNTASLVMSTHLVAFAEFVEEAGLVESRVDELVEIGWLVPASQAGGDILFRHGDIFKTRKLARICDDFELPCLAGAIIVDLLERIDELESRLRLHTSRI